MCRSNLQFTTLRTNTIFTQVLMKSFILKKTLKTMSASSRSICVCRLSQFIGLKDMEKLSSKKTRSQMYCTTLAKTSFMEVFFYCQNAVDSIEWKKGE